MYDAPSHLHSHATLPFPHGRRNEELDDKAVIRRLRRRVAELEREMCTLQERLPDTPEVRGHHCTLALYTGPAPSILDWYDHR